MSDLEVQIQDLSSETALDALDLLLMQDTGGVTKNVPVGTLKTHILAESEFQLLSTTTLAVAADTIILGPVSTTKKFYKIKLFAIATGGNINLNIRVNQDSAASYSYRVSNNGGAQSANTAATGLLWYQADSAAPLWAEIDVINISGQEKLLKGIVTHQNTAGAANAPLTLEGWGKWANTGSLASRFDFLNSGSGDFAIGSFAQIWGHD